MACTSCSSSSPVVSYTSSGCGAALGTTVSCVMPRRVSTPSVTPVAFTWIPSMIQAESGKAVIANGEDFNVLDCSYDGPVQFDSASGKIYVGTSGAATVVADNFACETSTLYGFPVYGLDPGCREVGANPDRNMAVVRPVESTTGILFGHRHTCSSNTAMSEEISPVEIVPGPMPATFPDDVSLLAYRVVPSTDSCAPQTVEYFNHNGVPVVEEAVLADLEQTRASLADTTTDNFGFAMWDKVSGKWKLKRLTKASFLSMITENSEAIPTFTHLISRITMYFRANTAAQGFSTVLTNYNLTSVVGYDAKYSSVLISVELASSGGTRSTLYEIKIGDQQYALIGSGSTVGVDRVTNQVVVPIPASKQIKIEATELTPGVTGTYGSTTISVLLDAFVI